MKKEQNGSDNGMINRADSRVTSLGEKERGRWKTTATYEGPSSPES